MKNQISTFILNPRKTVLTNLLRTRAWLLSQQFLQSWFPFQHCFEQNIRAFCVRLHRAEHNVPLSLVFKFATWTLLKAKHALVPVMIGHTWVNCSRLIHLLFDYFLLCTLCCSTYRRFVLILHFEAVFTR